jgi:hypothetical protein
MISDYFNGTTDANCTMINSYPTLEFELDGDSYAIPPSFYILQEGVVGALICTVGIDGTDLPTVLGKYAFVLGDTFIRQFYTIFDYGNASVGLCTSSQQ